MSDREPVLFVHTCVSGTYISVPPPLMSVFSLSALFLLSAILLMSAFLAFSAFLVVSAWVRVSMFLVQYVLGFPMDVNASLALITLVGHEHE